MGIQRSVCHGNHLEIAYFLNILRLGFVTLLLSTASSLQLDEKLGHQRQQGEKIPTSSRPNSAKDSSGVVPCNESSWACTDEEQGKETSNAEKAETDSSEEVSKDIEDAKYAVSSNSGYYAGHGDSQSNSGKRGRRRSAGSRQRDSASKVTSGEAGDLESSKSGPSSRGLGQGFVAGDASENFFQDSPADTSQDGEFTWATALRFQAGKSESSTMNVTVLPAFLDWKRQPVCLPVATSFVIINTSNDTSLAVESISTNDIQFYPADFRQTLVPPNGRMLVSMLYLPRFLGTAEGTLLLGTSAGRIAMQMHGRGVPSMFNLEPLVGVNVPAGRISSYRISLYNPFDAHLQVVEAQTHEDFFSLHLPRDAAFEQDSSKDIRQEEKQEGHGRQEGVAKLFLQGPTPLWELGSHESRPILDIKFTGDSIGRYVGVIRLHIKHPQMGLQVLMVPVEINAVGEGLHLAPREISFGTLTNPDQTVVRQVNLINTGSSPVMVEEVVSLAADPNLVEVKFERGLILQPGMMMLAVELIYVGGHETIPTQFPDADFAGSVLADAWWQEGRVEVRTNCSISPHLEIVYTARVMHGYFALIPGDSNIFLLTQYVPWALPGSAGLEDGDSLEQVKGEESKSIPVIAQSMAIVNHYATPLLIYSVIPSDSRFVVFGFVSGVPIAPGVATAPFEIRLNPVALPTMPLVAHLLVSSNLSEMVIPLHVHSGKLHFALPGEANADLKKLGRILNLDLGLVSVGHTLQRGFNVTNVAPKAVAITAISCTLPELVLQLDSVWDHFGNLVGGLAAAEYADIRLWKGSITVPLNKGGGKKTGKASSKANKKRSKSSSVAPVVYLQPGQTAVFGAQVTPTEADLKTGMIEMKTPYETRTISVQYESLMGAVALSPSPLIFPPSFPGRLLRKRLYATSTFSRPVNLSSLISSDVRIVPELTVTQLPPGVKTEIGSVVFDPARGPVEDNYMLGCFGAAAGGVVQGNRPGNNQGKKGNCDAACRGHGVEKTCGWGPHVREVEEQAAWRREEVWLRLRAEGQIDVEASLALQTSLVSNWVVSVKTSLSRPQVIADPAGLNFSRVQVGSAMMQPVRVTNPSDGPVRMQLLVGTAVERNCTCREELPQKKEVSSGRDGWHGLRTVKSDSPLFALAEGGVTEVVVPAKGEAVLGPIAFQPVRLCKVEGVIYVRNNLTRLESAPLVAEGGSGHLDFEERAGPGNALQLNVSAMQLGLEGDTDLEVQRYRLQEEASQKGWPRPVLRKLVAINRGNLPLLVSSLSLVAGRGDCQGHGFSISPCRSFSLAPGQTLPLELSFRPDFSASQVVQELRVSTSAGFESFQLIAQFPHELLTLCVEAAPSSTGDAMLRNLCLLLLTALLAVITNSLRRDFTVAPSPWFSSDSAEAFSTLGKKALASTVLHTRHQPQPMNTDSFSDIKSAEVIDLQLKSSRSLGEGTDSCADRHLDAVFGKSRSLGSAEQFNVTGSSEEVPTDRKSSGFTSVQQPAVGPLVKSESLNNVSSNSRDGGVETSDAVKSTVTESNVCKESVPIESVALSKVESSKGGSPIKGRGPEKGSSGIGTQHWSAKPMRHDVQNAGPEVDGSDSVKREVKQVMAGDARHSSRSPRKATFKQGSQHVHKHVAAEGEVKGAGGAADIFRPKNATTSVTDEAVMSPSTALGAATINPSSMEKERRSRKKKQRHVAIAETGKGDSLSFNGNRVKDEASPPPSPATAGGIASPTIPSSPTLRPIRTRMAVASTPTPLQASLPIFPKNASPPFTSVSGPGGEGERLSVSKILGKAGDNVRSGSSLGLSASPTVTVSLSEEGQGRSPVQRGYSPYLDVPTTSLRQFPHPRGRELSATTGGEDVLGGKEVTVSAAVMGLASGGRNRGNFPTSGKGSSAVPTAAATTDAPSGGFNTSWRAISRHGGATLEQNGENDLARVVGNKDTISGVQERPNNLVGDELELARLLQSPAEGERLGLRSAQVAGGFDISISRSNPYLSPASSPLTSPAGRPLPPPYKPSMGPPLSSSASLSTRPELQNSAGLDGSFVADSQVGSFSPHSAAPAPFIVGNATKNGWAFEEAALHRPPSFMDMKQDAVLQRPVGDPQIGKRWSVPPLPAPGGSAHTRAGMGGGTSGAGLGLGAGFDTLGSIGKRSLEAEGALGGLVYDIWGDHFAEIGANCTSHGGSATLADAAATRSLLSKTGFNPLASAPPSPICPPHAPFEGQPPSPTSSPFSSSFTGFSIFSQAPPPAPSALAHTDSGWAVNSAPSGDRVETGPVAQPPPFLFPSKESSLFASGAVVVDSSHCSNDSSAFGSLTNLGALQHRYGSQP